MTKSARSLGRAFRATPGFGTGHGNSFEDADARRMSMELDAIRARFPDHS